MKKILTFKIQHHSSNQEEFNIIYQSAIIRRGSGRLIEKNDFISINSNLFPEIYFHVTNIDIMIQGIETLDDNRKSYIALQNIPFLFNSLSKIDGYSINYGFKL